MPSIRCLTCNTLVDKKLARRGRCATCALELKAERSRQHRNLGQCPQDAVCGYCHGLYGPATPSNPMVWGHMGTRFVDGGRDVQPVHKRCNEVHQKRK